MDGKEVELMERHPTVFVGALKKGEVVKQEGVPGTRGKCSPVRVRVEGDSESWNAG